MPNSIDKEYDKWFVCWKTDGMLVRSTVYDRSECKQMKKQWQ
jgi:hypothetical protein